MNYLQLVQSAMRESGVTTTDPEPSTLVGVTGITLKFKEWVQQAWQEFQIENNDAELRRSWFATTVSPKFYFDLADNTWQQPSIGDTLTSEFSNSTCTVTRIVITNGGTWAGGDAQGFIEFSDMVNIPMIRERMQITSIGGTPTACRFIEWGDYDLSDPVEMGDSAVLNMEDVWWQTLRLQNVPTADNTAMNEQFIDYIDYSSFAPVLETGPIALARPVLCTQTPLGRLKLYPPPDVPYNLHGYYTKDLLVLTNDTDSPSVLKAFYHPMLFWRAVWYYGEYEQQPAITALGQKRYEVYKKRFDLEGRPPITMRPALLY